MATIDEICAIDDPAARAKAAEAAIRVARTLTAVRDSALCELRRKGGSYGEIASATDVSRSTVVSVTRSITIPPPAVVE